MGEVFSWLNHPLILDRIFCNFRASKSGDRKLYAASKCQSTDLKVKKNMKRSVGQWMGGIAEWPYLLFHKERNYQRLPASFGKGEVGWKEIVTLWILCNKRGRRDCEEERNKSRFIFFLEAHEIGGEGGCCFAYLLAEFLYLPNIALVVRTAELNEGWKKWLWRKETLEKDLSKPCLWPDNTHNRLDKWKQARLWQLLFLRICAIWERSLTEINRKI